MATANKSLKFFMRPQEEQIVTFTGPESFKDDEGNPIEFEVKAKSSGVPSATLRVPCGISSWPPCSTRSWTTRP